MLSHLLPGKSNSSTENDLYHGFPYILFILIGIFYLPGVGAPISAQILRRPEFAVVHYSFTQGTLYLHQPRRVNRPGLNIILSSIIIIYKLEE